MKKALFVILCMVLTLALAVTALAAPVTLEEASITIEVPQEMTATDATTEEAYALLIRTEGIDTINYVFTLSYIEALEGKFMEDLNEEEGNQLVAGINATLENPTMLTIELEQLNALVFANGDGSQLHYIALLDGWLCDLAAVKTDGTTLTDEEIQVASVMLNSISFGEAAEVAQSF